MNNQFDAKAWLNTQAKVEQGSRVTAQESDNYARVKSVISQLRMTGKDITAGYDEWVKVGMAFATEFGERGRDLYHEISALYPGYNPQEADEKYTNCLRTGRGTVTIATFFQMAKDAGADVGSSKKTTVPTKKSESVISSVKTVSEVEKFLRSIAEWRHNIISDVPEYKPANSEEWLRVEDYTVNSLWRQLLRNGIKCTTDTIWHIIQSDFSPHFDPVRSYLESLDPWKPDHPDYIKLFAEMVHTENADDVFLDYFRRWLVSTVAMWLGRGINQQILVLQGAQGSYKTSWLNAIIPPELQQYCCTKMDSARMTKDDRLKVSHFLFINLEELDVMSPSEMNQIKSLLTVSSTNERAAYAHRETFLHRLAAFVGSTNQSNFLTDRTGNRRYLTFAVKSIDSPFDNVIPYEGIYAQALYLLNNNFDYYFHQKDIEAINQRNKEFETPDLVSELVLSYFRQPEANEEALAMSAGEVYAKLCQYTQVSGLRCEQIGQALHRSGFKNTTIRGQKKYRVVFIDHDRREAVMKIDGHDAFPNTDAPVAATSQSVATSPDDDPELPF